MNSYPSVSELFASLQGTLELANGPVRVLDERRFGDEAVDRLAYSAVFGADDVRLAARWAIWESGQALGVTSFMPAEEMHNHDREYLIASIMVAMGGRAAEELIFGDGAITTGAGNDIQITLISAATQTDPQTQGATFFYGAPATPGLLAGWRRGSGRRGCAAMW